MPHWVPVAVFEQDYIKRAIRQLIEMAARAIGMAPKETSESLEVIAEAKRQVPLLPGMLDTLTPASVLQMLGDSSAALALFRLYEAEAAAYAHQGQEARAQRSLRRALLFFLEAPVEEVDAETRSQARELARRLPQAQLTAAQWAALTTERARRS